MKNKFLRVKRTLYPSQNGTKNWERKYGKKLICIRYRIDEEKKKKLTTVEIIVDEKDWNRNCYRIPLNKILHVKVKYGEVKIGSLIKNAGGKWNRELKLWELPYKDILALGFEDRIVT